MKNDKGEEISDLEHLAERVNRQNRKAEMQDIAGDVWQVIVILSGIILLVLYLMFFASFFGR